MNLKNVYDVAYGFKDPFNGQCKNGGSFLFSNILFDLIKTDGQDNNITFIDLYCWFLNKSGLTLDDLEYAFEKFVGGQGNNFDEVLYYNFSENKLFDKFNRAKELMPDFISKTSGLNLHKVYNINEDYSTYDRLLLSFGNPRLLLIVLDKDYNKGRCDIKNKGSKGLEKLIEQYYGLNNVQFDYPRLTAKLVREGKLNAESVHKVTNKMLEDCNSSKIQYINMALKCSPKEKKLNSVSLSNGVKTYRENDFSNYKNVQNLKKHIIGQEDAVNRITNKILSAYVGFRSDKRPIATFLLTGPSGVGKTETAKTVADLCVDGNIFTVDMSTFKSDADISRLIGGSPNYVGYGDKNEFCEFMQEHPNCVLLFDEIDKAHKGCLDLLMRMLDEGEFINAKGEVISLKDAIIFCTTNLTEYINESFEKLVEERLTTHSGLRREFVGRFSDVIEYKKLNRVACVQIATNMTKAKIEAFESNNPYNLKLTYSDALIDKIVSQSNTDLFGARDLDKSIQKCLVDVVSLYIIENDVNGTTLKVTENGVDKVQFENKKDEYRGM